MSIEIFPILYNKSCIEIDNAHTPIGKQSNQVWNTQIHLKNNGPYIKVPLVFWFLIMTFNLGFYHQLWVEWVYIHTGNSSGHTGQTC